MNADTPASSDGTLARIRALSAQTAGALRSSRRQQWILLGAALPLFSVALFFVNRASNLIGRIDPQTIAQIGRYEAEQRLPQLRQSLRDHLLRESPHLARKAIDAAVEALPELRERLARTIEARMQSSILEFETSLVARLQTSIASQKASLDRLFPEARDDERVRLLVQTVAADFQSVFESALAEIHPAFTRELEGLESFLGGVATGDERLLTERERIEAEIIETVLCLLLREDVR